MAKRKKDRHRTSGRVTPKGTRPRGQGQPGSFGSHDTTNGSGTGPMPPSDPGSWNPFAGHDPGLEPDFDMLRSIRRAMEEDHPFALFDIAATMMNFIDPRGDDASPDPEHATDPAPIHELVERFVELDQPEIDVMLATFGELTTDEVLARRITRLLAHREPRQPRWLSELGDSEVTSVMEQGHVLGTTVDVLVGLRIAGYDLTAVVLIDHNLGTVVDDAFFFPEPADAVIARFQSQLGEHADLYPRTEVDPADTRVRITEAIDRGATMVPPVETETWPRCRPLLEWVLGLMPEGGASNERPDRPELRGTGFDAALLASLGIDLADELGIDLGDEHHGSLEQRAGGASALAALTEAPLPDEPFDWAGIEADITERVAEVLDLGDAFADASFGVEFRTATRRLLAAIASRAPKVFRRRGAASSAAAAVAWLVARDNHLFSTSPGFMTVKDLLAAFGRSGSVSTRAETMLTNAGLIGRFERFYCPPEMLLADTRGRLIAERDLAHGRSSPRTGTVHRLKVTLEGIRPPVWRRLLVPSDATLAELHQILQMSFGWYDDHLHDFEIGGTRFAPENGFVDFGFGTENETVDEESVTLAEVLGAGGRGLYNYDFGDDWSHRIVVEAVEPREPGAEYPQCVTGRRSGPPEDIGGPWGYGEFLVALGDPGHEEHEDYVEWIGGGWDPEEFDRDRLTAGLLRLTRATRRRR